MLRGRRFWKKHWGIVMSTNEKFARENAVLRRRVTELKEENVRLENLLHKKVNALIDALDRIDELEGEMNGI